MQDQFLKAISSDGSIRVIIATTTNLVEEARLRHQLSHTATAALGRALTAGALLTPLVSRHGQIVLQFKGNGPLGIVFVDAYPTGIVRGYVEHPEVELPLNILGNYDVGSAIGNCGILQVTIDHGFGVLQTSTCELISGEVGEDVNRYLCNSEQLGSIVVVGTHLNNDKVEASGGFIIQLLPDHTEDTICKLENNIATFGTFTNLMLKGLDLESILERIINGFKMLPFEERKHLIFACKCSQERFNQAITLFGRDEILDMAEIDGGAQGKCQFCNEDYYLSKDELINLAQNI